MNVILLLCMLNQDTLKSMYDLKETIYFSSPKDQVSFVVFDSTKTKKGEFYVLALAMVKDDTLVLKYVDSQLLKSIKVFRFDVLTKKTKPDGFLYYLKKEDD